MKTNNLDALKSMTLLYVEDDPSTREELALMLEPWVANLYVAEDGQAGLDVYKIHRPDIVLTDIQMPRVGGLAMSGEIRRISPDQAILVLSAYNDVEYLFRAIELGIDQYITKPVNFERLLERLGKIAGGILALKDKERTHRVLEQYKHLVDESAIVCKADSLGVITYVNSKLCEISGFKPEDLIGKTLSSLRHERESVDQCQQILDLVISGRPWRGILRNRTKDGRMYVVESSLVPVLNERDEVSEIVSLDVEITSIYENYESLVEALNKSHLSLSEQRHLLNEYKHTLELGTCICVTDRNFVIRSVNRQFESMLGYRSEELEGKGIDCITRDLPRERCLKEAQETHPDSLNSRIVSLRNADGREMQFSIGCVGVHDLAGEVESVILICQDITESMQLNREIVETQRELLYMLGDVVESRSLETAQHVRRVAEVSKFLALKIGLDTETAEMIETAAPMHDVGKVGIPDAILHKQGRLTEQEYEEMKNHARIGQRILGNVERPLISLAARIAQQHHERWDGKGYPNGLSGEEIDIAGRIVAVSDVLDALFSPRSYKPAWAEDKVLEYFREQRGRQFDPILVDLLFEHWEEIKALREVKAGT